MRNRQTDKQIDVNTYASDHIHITSLHPIIQDGINIYIRDGIDIPSHLHCNVNRNVGLCVSIVKIIKVAVKLLILTSKLCTI